MSSVPAVLPSPPHHQASFEELVHDLVFCLMLYLEYREEVQGIPVVQGGGGKARLPHDSDD